MKTSARSFRLHHRAAGVRHREPRRRPEGRRRAQDPAHGHPAQRLDPRGGDGVGRGAVHGGLQQPGDVRPARGQEQPRHRSCPTWPPAGRGRDDDTKLRLHLREGVKWHDGKPFTAKDVACTFDLLLDGRARASSGAIRARRGGPTSRRSPPTATPRSRSISRRRSPRCWRCSPRATRRSIPATCRPTRCGASRSAPARSSSSSSR